MSAQRRARARARPYSRLLPLRQKTQYANVPDTGHFNSRRRKMEDPEWGTTHPRTRDEANMRREWASQGSLRCSRGNNKTKLSSNDSSCTLLCAHAKPRGRRSALDSPLGALSGWWKRSAPSVEPCCIPAFPMHITQVRLSAAAFSLLFLLAVDSKIDSLFVACVAEHHVLVAF